MTTTVSRLRDYIVDNVAWDGDPEELTATTSLFEEEVLDSLALLGLVAFIEDEFGIEIDNEDLLFEHFETLETLARFVDDKVRAAP